MPLNVPAWGARWDHVSCAGMPTSNRLLCCIMHFSLQLDVTIDE
jgi:hypothetical protein